MRARMTFTSSSETKYFMVPWRSQCSARHPPFRFDHTRGGFRRISAGGCVVDEDPLTRLKRLGEDLQGSEGGCRMALWRVVVGAWMRRRVAPQRYRRTGPKSKKRLPVIVTQVRYWPALPSRRRPSRHYPGPMRLEYKELVDQLALPSSDSLRQG